MSKKSTVDINYAALQARVGKRALLARGIMRGPVTVEAYRTMWGRIEFLVRSRNGEREWVREASLTWPAEPEAKQ